MSTEAYEVATAWRDLWMSGEDEPPGICVCGLPADHVDIEGQEMCEGCHAAEREEMAQQEEGR